MTADEAREVRAAVLRCFAKATSLSGQIDDAKATVVALVAEGSESSMQAALAAKGEVDALIAVRAATHARAGELLEHVRQVQEIDRRTVGVAGSHKFERFWGPSNRIPVVAAYLRPYRGEGGGLLAEFECPFCACWHRVGVDDPMRKYERVFTGCAFEHHGQRSVVLVDAAGLEP